jgi:hypothetical protein
MLVLTSWVDLYRLAPHHDEPIEAIIIMHDPIDWAPEIQVAVDVLIGGTVPCSIFHPEDPFGNAWGSLTVEFT